ncbi:MAG: hypothetical protein AAB384_04155 [Patescibacteria group bacterium]
MNTLQFHRDNDEVVYTFHLDGTYNDRPRWRREDKNIVVVYIDHIGWCVLDEEENQVSWPFPETRDTDATMPPLGKWLSWKKGKSYVYTLSKVN